MASRNIMLDLLKQFKNFIVSSIVERVMSEQFYDQTSLLRRGCLVQNIALAGAASQNFTTQLPAGARVIFAGLYFETAITLTTAVKVAIGTAATPAAFFLSGTVMTIGTNQILPVADTNARVAAATTIQVTTTDTSGNLAGTGTGTVKAVVIYEYAQPILP